MATSTLLSLLLAFILEVQTTENADNLYSLPDSDDRLATWGKIVSKRIDFESIHLV